LEDLDNDDWVMLMPNEDLNYADSPYVAQQSNSFDLGRSVYSSILNIFFIKLKQNYPKLCTTRN